MLNVVKVEKNELQQFSNLCYHEKHCFSEHVAMPWGIKAIIDSDGGRTPDLWPQTESNTNLRAVILHGA